MDSRLLRKRFGGRASPTSRRYAGDGGSKEVVQVSELFELTDAQRQRIDRIPPRRAGGFPSRPVSTEGDRTVRRAPSGAQ